MPNPSKENRPPLVSAAQWVSQITTVGLEMALPAWLGYLGDQKWDTSPWLVIVGAALGFTVGMKHLLQMVAAENRSNSKRSSDKGSSQSHHRTP